MSQETDQNPTVPEPTAAPAAPRDMGHAVRPPRRRLRRLVVGTLLVKLALALVVGLGVGVAYLRLASGPLTFEGLSHRVESSIAGRLGPGWRAVLRDSAIELDGEGSLALRASGLDIRNPEGALVVRAPLAVVSLDTWSLATLSFQARAIDFRDLQLTAVVRRDGAIEFAAAETESPKGAVPALPPSPPPAADAPSALSTAVASVLGLIVDPRGVVGALDRARLTNARVTLVDEEGHERAAYRRVDALFRRTGGEGRSFEMRLEGPHGAWRFGGDVHDLADGRRRGVLTLDDLPTPDLLLLSGQSRLPVTTDLKLSVRANVELAASRLSALDLAVRTSDGTILIEEKDFRPIAIEGLSARASWAEAGRTLEIASVEYLGGGNEVRLKGALSTAPAADGAAWTLALDGRDATLRGAGAADEPVRIAEAEIRVAGRDGGVALDRMTLKGPDLDGTMSGSAGAASDRKGMTLKLEARRTGVRTALRLWPENITPAIRDYLVQHVRGGRVEALSLAVAMSDAELATAAAGGPVPEQALRIGFSVSEGRMAVAEGAPPISHSRVSGEVTGTATRIRDASAQLRLSDTRRLTIADGAFLIDGGPGVAPVAKVGFRLGGTADALAALLQTPFLKGVANAEMDPASIKGAVDLRVDFPISLENPGEVADLPVVIAGALTDVALDKAFGKDRIEAQRLAVSYDQAGFALKGDARLAGAPTTIDLRQPRGGGPGEAVVTVVLDEALRAKKGLPVAPQLAGPVPLRVVAALGKAAASPPAGSRGGTRIEADLTRAAVDGALPGWTKAAGRPGKLSFTLADNGDVRDIVLEAGATALRGSASFNGEGVLERADLTQLKLSTGDDMRAQIERHGGGYRLSVKGNTADARPFLKTIGNNAVSTRDKEIGPSKDVEADIAVNILTGFNDEALTNASLKLSRRGADVRSFQLQGRFRSAAFSAQMSKPDRGPPLLRLTSEDAGATLRYLDIYRRMHGGTMGLQIALADGPQSGAIEARGFTLRNEPALKSIMSQQGDGEPLGGDRGAKARIRELDDSGIGFDRASAQFVKTNGRIDFREAAISGQTMGFTLNGWLDYARDRTDISGTFVPLYGLNNAFAQLPLIGPILGGGQNEGLFAINFRVAGAVAQPQVSVNPLSAVAPGFLRKLFSAGGGDDLLAGSAPPRPMSDR